MLQACHGEALIIKLESMNKRRKEPVTCIIYNAAAERFGRKVDSKVYF